jgi:hypothetical protein
VNLERINAESECLLQRAAIDSFSAASIITASGLMVFGLQGLYLLPTPGVLSLDS